MSAVRPGDFIVTNKDYFDRHGIVATELLFFDNVQDYVEFAEGTWKKVYIGELAMVLAVLFGRVGPHMLLLCFFSKSQSFGWIEYDKKYYDVIKFEIEQ